MYEFKLNPGKNALLCVLIGKFSLAEAIEYNKKYAEGVSKLRPGFALVVDLTRFIPCEENVREEFKKGTEHAVKQGLDRVVRIVTDDMCSAIGNMQWNRTAKEMGYRVDVVTSMADAEKKLGWV